MTFKALSEVVRTQGLKINELEKVINTKASKSELNSGLNIKANIADVMKTFSEAANNIESRPTMEEMQSYLNEKVSKTDIQVIYLNFYLKFYLTSKPSLEEVKHMVNSCVSTKEFEREVTNIYQRVEEYQKETAKRNMNNSSVKELSHLAQLLGIKIRINLL